MSDVNGRERGTEAPSDVSDHHPPSRAGGRDISIRRDPEWERVWLTLCEQTAPMQIDTANGLADRAVARLEALDQEIGGRWNEFGLEAFAERISKAAAELAAWAAIAQQALPLEQLETQGQRDLVTGVLYTAGAAAATAHGAGTLLKHARAEFRRGG